MSNSSTGANEAAASPTRVQWMLGLSAIAGAFAGAALVLALVGLTCFTGDDGRARTIYATSSICALAALGAVAFIVDLRRRTPG